MEDSAIPSPPEGVDRKRATLAILPFLLLGLADVYLLLEWGLDPLWGFVILPPILFVSLIGWIAFKGEFGEDRGIVETDVDD